MSIYLYGNNFYEVVNTAVTWTEAFNAAAAKSYNGVNGHLVTVSSAGEQAFLTNLTKYAVSTGWDNQSIWLAASDASAEGVWKWVAGPEAGQQFWSGNATGAPTNGSFNAWITDYLQNENGDGGINGVWSNPTNTGSDYAFLDARYSSPSNWDDAYSSTSTAPATDAPIASASGIRNAYVIEYEAPSGARGNNWDNVNILPDGSVINLGANIANIDGINITGTGYAGNQTIYLSDALFTNSSNVWLNIWAGNSYGVDAVINYKIDASALTSIHSLGFNGPATGNDTLIGGTGTDNF